MASQARPGQAGCLTTASPFFKSLFASPAKAWLVAGLTSVFRPGFGQGLPQSDQAPDARVVEEYFVEFLHSLARKSTNPADSTEQQRQKLLSPFSSEEQHVTTYHLSSR